MNFFSLVKHLNCKKINWIVDQNRKLGEANGLSEDYSKAPLNLKFGHTPNYIYNRSYEVYSHMV